MSLNQVNLVEDAMSVFIGICEYHIDMKACRSLKEKRQIVKSICERLGKNRNTSACEADHNDYWKSSVLITSVFTGSPKSAEAAFEKARSVIESCGVEIIGERKWILRPEDFSEWLICPEE